MPYKSLLLITGVIGVSFFLGVLVGNQFLGKGNLREFEEKQGKDLEENRSSQNTQRIKSRYSRRSGAFASTDERIDRVKKILSGETILLGKTDERLAIELQYLLYHLPIDQLEEAFTLLEDFGSKSLYYNKFLEALFYRMAELDPKRALEKVALLPQSKNKAFSQVMQAWGKQDLDAALRYVETVADSTVKIAMLKGLEKGIDSPHLEKWIAHLKRGNKQIYASHAERIYSALAWKDPQLALERALKEPIQSTQRTALHSALAVWTRRDSESALAWFETLDKEARKVVVPALTRWLVQSDIKKSGDYLISLSEEEQKIAFSRYPTFILISVEHEQDGDLGRIINWINKYVYEEKNRRMAISSALQAAAYSKDPEKVASYLDHTENEQTRLRVIANFMDRWVKRDKESALAWAKKLENAKEREYAYKPVVRDMMGRGDSENIEKLIEEEDVSMRDKIRALAAHSFSGDFKERIRWAEDIEEEKERIKTLKNVVSAWFDRDREKALRYMEKMPFLSEEDRKQIKEREIMVITDVFVDEPPTNE